MKYFLLLALSVFAAPLAFGECVMTVGSAKTQPAQFVQAITVYNAQGQFCDYGGTNCLRPGPVYIAENGPGGWTVACQIECGSISLFVIQDDVGSGGAASAKSKGKKLYLLAPRGSKLTDAQVAAIASKLGYAGVWKPAPKTFAAPKLVPSKGAGAAALLRKKAVIVPGLPPPLP